MSTDSTDSTDKPDCGLATLYTTLLDGAKQLDLILSEDGTDLLTGFSAASIKKKTLQQKPLVFATMAVQRLIQAIDYYDEDSVRAIHQECYEDITHIVSCNTDEKQEKSILDLAHFVELIYIEHINAINARKRYNHAIINGGQPDKEDI